MKEAREAKKKETGKPQLSVAWMTEWIPQQPKLLVEYTKAFGEVYTRTDLINKIVRDKRMEAELEQQVINKWEAREEAAATKRPRKYS